MDRAGTAGPGDYLRGRMEGEQIPAIAMAIVRDGQITDASAYGIANLEWEIPATTDTAFQLASATKPLTGTLLMMLVEEGVLRLDAPVKEYVPSVPAAWDAITVRHLATHASGLPAAAVAHVHIGTAELPDDQRPPQTVAAIVEVASELPLEYEPGSEAKYGLTDFVVLTAILETVTGTDFPSLLRQRLLEPLGMKSTCFDYGADHGASRLIDIVPRRASLYRTHEGKLVDFRFLYPVWSYAGGGIYSSVNDLAAWIMAIDRGDLLRPESLDEMWTPQILTAGKPAMFSPGWHVYTHNDRQVVGHSGGPALGDIMRFRDEKLTIIALLNQQAVPPTVAPGIADIIQAGG